VAITKDQATFAGIAIAVATSTAALVQSTTSTSVPELAHVQGAPAPPPPCERACTTLAKMCGEQKWSNCESFVSRYAATDAGWSCSQPLTPDVLKGLGLERCSK
jgi:hypothetical protein